MRNWRLPNLDKLRARETKHGMGNLFSSKKKAEKPKLPIANDKGGAKVAQTE